MMDISFIFATVLFFGLAILHEQLRAMGIRTMMITGDNPLTAAAIAREAGVEIFWQKRSPKTRWR